MTAVTLFDLEPTVERGVHGTVVVWPSGAQVWVRDDRMRRATLAMFAATTPSVLAFEQMSEEFDRDVMAPLREELRAASESALAVVLGAGDPSWAEQRREVRGEVVADEGAGLFESGAAGGALVDVEREQGDGDGEADECVEGTVGGARHGGHAVPMRGRERKLVNQGNG